MGNHFDEKTMELLRGVLEKYGDEHLETELGVTDSETKSSIFAEARNFIEEVQKNQTMKEYDARIEEIDDKIVGHLGRYNELNAETYFLSDENIKENYMPEYDEISNESSALQDELKSLKNAKKQLMQHDNASSRKNNDKLKESMKKALFGLKSENEVLHKSLDILKTRFVGHEKEMSTMIGYSKANAAETTQTHGNIDRLFNEKDESEKKGREMFSKEQDQGKEQKTSREESNELER